MGIKRKAEIKDEHLKTNLFINKFGRCSNCPLKLYAKDDDKITLGIGNIVTDTIIILPSYDVETKIGYETILQIVKDAYENITGLNLLELYYVTRTIKCYNKTDFNLEKDAIKHCLFHLFYEIGRIRPKKVIIFDKQIYDFGLYECNAGKFIAKTVISPGVMYYDNIKLKDIFMKQFRDAIYDSDT